jgi:muconolactone delta-isomerase
MRFLVVTKATSPIPPDMALPLFEALSGWAKENTAAGKIEQTWSFAGTPGGGGIINVPTLEELDALMTTFPLQPFSMIEVYPLVEIEASLERVRGAIRAMMPPAS